MNEKSNSDTESEHNKEQLPKSNDEKIGKRQPKRDTFKKENLVGDLLVIFPVMVVCISLIFMLTRMWDWEFAFAVSTLIVVVFTFLINSLKPNVTRGKAKKDIKK